MWHYREWGAGPPLVLLHGIGMSHAAWRAVIPFLRRTRRVIAFDIAGFGETPALASGVAPTAEHLAQSLAKTLEELSLREPVDIAGNSLGGAIALEFAKLGRARSVVAISPACLWRQAPPFHVRYVFDALCAGSNTCPAVLKLAMRVLQPVCHAVEARIQRHQPLFGGGIGDRRARAQQQDDHRGKAEEQKDAESDEQGCFRHGPLYRDSGDG